MNTALCQSVAVPYVRPHESPQTPEMWGSHALAQPIFKCADALSPDRARAEPYDGFQRYVQQDILSESRHRREPVETRIFGP